MHATYMPATDRTINDITDRAVSIVLTQTRHVTPYAQRLLESKCQRL